MILLNSFAYEVILLCLFYSPPSAPEDEGEEEAYVTINIVGIIIGSSFAALITIPMMLAFAWLYEPMIYVRLGRWALRLVCCWPFWLCDGCSRTWLKRCRRGGGSKSHADADGEGHAEVREPNVIYHAVATTQLLVRAGASLQSDKVASLEAGARLAVLAERCLLVEGALEPSQACKRVQIGVESQRRPLGMRRVTVVGWVTAEKGGRAVMQVVEGDGGGREQGSGATVQLDDDAVREVTKEELADVHGKAWVAEEFGQEWTAEAGGVMAEEGGAHHRIRAETPLSGPRTYARTLSTPAVGSSRRPAEGHGRGEIVGDHGEIIWRSSTRLPSDPGTLLELELEVEATAVESTFAPPRIASVVPPRPQTLSTPPPSPPEELDRTQTLPLSTPPPSPPEELEAADSAPVHIPADERKYSYASLDESTLKASLTHSWARRDWAAVRRILFGWTCNVVLFYSMLFFFLWYGCELFEPRGLEAAPTDGGGASGEPAPGIETIPAVARRLARAAVGGIGGGAGGGGVGGGGAGGGGAGGGGVGADGGLAGGTARGVGRTSDRRGPAGNTDELLISWALSAFQRFVLHEPTLILAAKGLPMLFGSAFCANCCGETIVNALSICFEGVMACLADLKG